MKTPPPLLEIRRSLRANRLRVFLLIVLTYTGGAISAHAQEKLVGEYSWKALASAGKVNPSFLYEESGRGTVYQVVNATSAPLRKTLLTIEAPAITADFYRLDGNVRYDGVEGDSYLEMWSTFPPATASGPERSYFSRTLASENQMGKLHGTSDWREFVLPFNATGAGAHPARLTFNLVLAGKGTAVISDLKLWQIAGVAGMPPSGTSYLFAPGVVRLLFLAVCGGMGAIIAGTLFFCERMAGQPNRRAVVMTITILTVAFSVLPLAAGIWFWQMRGVTAQIWSPLVVCGLLGMVIPPMRLLTLRHRYQQIEMRRMAAFDALT